MGTARYSERRRDPDLEDSGEVALARPPDSGWRRAAQAIEALDQRVILRGMAWGNYEALLAMRQDPGVRMSYLDGEIELMSPSRSHEGIKTLMGGLLEAYAVETGLDMSGLGSSTLKGESKAAGTEPDECYVVGDVSKETPDLAVEVVWTHGGLDKLEIYARLGVREVWVWDQVSGIRVFALRDGEYHKVPASEVFPALDVAHLGSFLGRSNHSQAVREYLAALRARRG